MISASSAKNTLIFTELQIEDSTTLETIRRT